MQMTMDPGIASFNIKEANKLRKGIAKKVPKIIEETRQMFYEKGTASKTRKEMLDYVWKRQIGMSLGYSFSDLHTIAYSTIALQQMNLAYYYPTIMWNCACLSVDANAVDENDYTFIDEVADYWIDEEEDEEEEFEEEKEVSTKKKKTSKVNYDKIASALGHFKDKVTIKLPDINKAKMGFIPDVEDNSIMFGFKGISRIGDDIITNIIDNRPYTNIQDFLGKMVVDGKKLISKDRVVNLIKAGCFDNIEKSDRATVMERFINTLVPRKKTLNLRNMDKLIEYDLVPEEFNLQKGIYLFTKEARKRRDKVNGYYNMDDIMVLWYRKWMKQEPPLLNNEYKVNSAKWDAFYDKSMDVIRTWIKSNLKDLIDAFHKVEFETEFNKYAIGSELKWELDSLNFYHSGHPLASLVTPITTTPLDRIVDGEFDGY